MNRKFTGILLIVELLLMQQFFDFNFMRSFIIIISFKKEKNIQIEFYVDLSRTDFVWFAFIVFTTNNIEK